MTTIFSLTNAPTRVRVFPGWLRAREIKRVALVVPQFAVSLLDCSSNQNTHFIMALLRRSLYNYHRLSFRSHSPTSSSSYRPQAVGSSSYRPQAVGSSSYQPQAVGSFTTHTQCWFKCGRPSHFAANCEISASTSTSNPTGTHYNTKLQPAIADESCDSAKFHDASLCFNCFKDKLYGEFSSGCSYDNIRGRLRKHNSFWHEIGASQFVTNVISMAIISP